MKDLLINLEMCSLIKDLFLMQGFRLKELDQVKIDILQINLKINKDTYLKKNNKIQKYSMIKIFNKNNINKKEV